MQASSYISVTRALRFLIVVWLVLLSASVFQDLAGWALGSDIRIWRFDVDFEGSFYTWHSSTLLLLAALVAMVIAAREMEAHAPFRFHWLGIAVLFAFLSMDETLALHEQLSGVLSAREQVEGWLHFRWVVPVGLAVLAFAVAYLHFLAHLPRGTAALMIAAGTVFVLGAIGMELVAGKLLSTGQADEIYQSIAYRLLTNVEEGLEAGGVLLFLATLFRHCRETGLYRVELLHATGVPQGRRMASAPAE